MPEIAEAQALLAALSETDEVKAEAARRQRLTQLQSPTATRSSRRAAAARRKRRKRSPEPASGRLATRTRRSDWRCSRLWPMGRQLRARRVAVDAGARSGLPQRRRGETQFARGRRRPSRRRDHLLVRRRVSRGAGSLERALALFQPGRDDDLAFRFGLDPGIAAMVYLANASWPLGEVDRAISLIDRMQTRMRGPHPCRHARICKNAFGPVRFDARRPCARRAEGVRTRPTRA